MRTEINMDNFPFLMQPATTLTTADGSPYGTKLSTVYVEACECAEDMPRPNGAFLLLPYLVKSTE